MGLRRVILIVRYPRVVLKTRDYGYSLFYAILTLIVPPGVTAIITERLHD